MKPAKKSSKLSCLSRYLMILVLVMSVFAPQGYSMLQTTLSPSLYTAQEWYPAISREDVNFISLELTEAIYEWIGCSLDTDGLKEVITGTLMEISDEYDLAIVSDEKIATTCGSLDEFSTITNSDDNDLSENHTSFIWEF